MRHAPGLITFVALWLAATPAADAQRTAAPSNGSDLQGWKVEHTRAQVRDGILHVGKGNGWVRTERVYADFVLSLDIRIPADRAAAIFVRAWPTFTPSSSPSNGYRLRITGGKAPSHADGWQHLELEGVGGTLKLRVDGELVHTVTDIGNPQGHIALSAPEETVEFRAIEIRTLPPAPRAFRPDTFTVGGATGVVTPLARSRPQPRYTADAMRARITGTVIMQAVVLPDGTVSDVVILQSLDPDFGLDKEAVATAKRWTFSPGTRDGQPVAVRIMIELEFNLK